MRRLEAVTSVRAVGRVASLALVCASLALARPAAALFDDLPVSPRARAMGEATTCLTNDAWAFYYNPALLPMLAQPQAGFATVSPNALDFNRLTSTVVAAPLGSLYGGLAIGWRRYSVSQGDVDLATENTLSFSNGFRLFGDASTA